MQWFLSRLDPARTRRRPIPRQHVNETFHAVSLDIVTVRGTAKYLIYSSTCEWCLPFEDEENKKFYKIKTKEGLFIL